MRTYNVCKITVLDIQDFYTSEHLTISTIARRSVDNLFTFAFMLSQ